jgi:seryl-tRNA synthetase
MKALEMPYHIVNVCTGDIGTVAAKKYDLEGWSPRENKYIELMSCSNCTGYQAARLGIRYREGGDARHLHTLNSTMVATSRALRLILENYQRKDGGVDVPNALQPFMGGKKEIAPK